MKYVRMLGLLTAMAIALLAVSSNASATTITSPTGTAYTGEIKATSEGHTKFANPIATLECHSSIAGKIEAHGAGLTAKGNITSLLWGTSGNLNGTCTNSWHYTTIALGSLEIHWKAEHEGTVTWTGALWSSTRFGITCNYQTNATHIGTFTDSHKTGATATLHINASIPLAAGSSGLCGSGNTSWAGSYRIETPDLIFVDK